MIHASNYKPRVYPFKGTGDSTEIDRLQELRGTLTLNREKIKEIGRKNIVDWKKRIPTLRLSLTQLEYGAMEFWQQLANVASSDNDIDVGDFKNSMVDIAAFKTDDAGTFLGTVWYPNLRLESFSLNIGDPEAFLERSFDFVGEDEITLLNDNKYLIMRRMLCDGGLTYTISDGGTTYPDPVMDPDNSGQYVFKVVFYDGSADTTTELTRDTNWTYNSGTKVVTLIGVVTETSVDYIRVYWSAGSYTTGVETFTNNDTNASSVSADACDIWLTSGNRVYKLQSVGIDLALDRTDYKEIGSTEVIQRGVRDTTITITLGRILEDHTVEEVLRGKQGLSYGKIDPREFNDDLDLKIKLYSDNAKGTFLMRYAFSLLSPIGLEAGAPLDDYITRGATLEGQSMVISTTDV